MKPVVVMVVGCLGTGLVALVVTGPGLTREVLFGMLAPLLAAVVSWETVARTFRRNRKQVTNVMVVAFGAKMVFFGAYVAVMLRGLALRPVPFVVSFTAYFIALHFAEAVWLRRLFVEDASGAR